MKDRPQEEREGQPGESSEDTISCKGVFVPAATVSPLQSPRTHCRRNRSDTEDSFSVSREPSGLGHWFTKTLEQRFSAFFVS